MKKLTLFLIILLGFRVSFYFMWNGSHSPEYFTKLNNFREAMTWAVLGSVSTYICKHCKEHYCGLALFVFMLFSYSFSFVALADFMPALIQRMIVSLRPSFFSTWLIVFIATIVFYLTSINGRVRV